MKKLPYKIYQKGHGLVAEAETKKGADLAIKTLIKDQYGALIQGYEKGYWIIINWEDD